MTVSATQYNEDKKKFFKAHKHDFQVETSPMDQYSRYMKTYYFADNSAWYEVITTTKHITLEAVAEFAGMDFPIKQDITVCEVEYWNSDCAGSKFYYEK